MEWKGARLSLREAAIQPLPAGEFYWREIIGLRARLPDGSELGRVEEIWSTRASDVLVVCKGSHRNLVPPCASSWFGWISRRERSGWILQQE